MLQRLAQDVEELAGRDVGLMPDAEVRETYLALRRELDRLEACAARLLATLHLRGLPAGDGAASTPAWVQWQTGQRAGDAKAALGTALACETLPLTRKAWVQGEISSSAARTIASGRRVGYEDVYGEIEDILVDFAARHELRALDATIRHYQVRADALDDKDPAELNGLQISKVGNRWALSADLDQLSGKVVDAAIHAAMDKPTAEDTRTPERRRADALVDVCRFVLDHADLPVEGGEAPHAGVVLNWETIVDGAAAKVGETPLDLPTIHELLCEANISRIVIGPAGVPLDVGRAMRNPSKAVRKAVMLRDGGCRFPGCHRRPNWCHTHHCVPWECGGDTKLCNLVALCSFHHHLIHRPGWTANFDGRTFTVTRPDGSIVGRTENQTSSSPRSTVTARPPSITRSPATRTRTVPPRGDAWYPVSSVRPNRWAQNGASAQWAEPVTGSSSTPTPGAKKRDTKSAPERLAAAVTITPRTPTERNAGRSGS